MDARFLPFLVVCGSALLGVAGSPLRRAPMVRAVGHWSELTDPELPPVDDELLMGLFRDGVASYEDGVSPQDGRFSLSMYGAMSVVVRKSKLMPRYLHEEDEVRGLGAVYGAFKAGVDLEYHVSTYGLERIPPHWLTSGSPLRRAPVRPQVDPAVFSRSGGNEAIFDHHGEVLHRSDNLRGILRYASKTIINEVRIYEGFRREHPQHRMVIAFDGDTYGVSDWMSVEVMRGWLRDRISWRGVPVVEDKTGERWEI